MTRIQSEVMSLPPELAPLVAHQLNVATRRQLLQGGLTLAEIRWAMGRRWRMLLPRVILLEPGLPSTEQRLVAALLLAGPDSWLAGPTAAALHGLSGAGITAPVHVLVPPHRTSRTVSWVRISRSYLGDERVVARGPLRISCRPRALVDAAAFSRGEEDARALVIEAVQRRRVRLDDVAHWVEARSNHDRPRLRRAVAEAAAGAWSLPEAELLRLVGADARLPAPCANPILRDEQGRRLTTPDVWFDNVALAVMVHSRTYHAGVLDWEATVASDEDLREAGAEVVTVTPTAIVGDPARVTERVVKAYARASRRPRPPGLVAEPRQPPWEIAKRLA